MALWLAVGLVLLWIVLRISGVAGTYPLIQLLAFTPYLLPVVGVLAVASGVLRRWTPLAAALGCQLVLALLVLPRATGAADAAGGGAHLRVLSANMKVGASDAANLVALVRAHDVDLLALQEFTPDAEDRLDEAGLAPCCRIGSATRTWFRAPRCTPGYRSPTAGTGRCHPTSARRTACCTCRTGAPCGWSRRTRPHRTRGRSPPLGATAGAGAALPIPAHGPQLLLGDFNATFDHAPFRRLVATGYTDAAGKLGKGLTTTWPYDGRPVPKVTLDHVLVAGLRVYDFSHVPESGQRPPRRLRRSRAALTGRARADAGVAGPRPAAATPGSSNAGPDQLKMLTARATTSATVTSDTADWNIIDSFAQRLSGNVSVGLNAVALVKDRYR